MEKSRVLSIAKARVLKEKGWSEFPADAVLKHFYFNSDKQRWVLEWKRKIGLFYSEIDRILVWLDSEGNLLKLDVHWSAFKIPEISANISANIRAILTRRGIHISGASEADIKRALATRVKEVEGIDVEIIDYRKINKRIYTFFIPEDEIEDYYWLAKKSESTFVLINSDGHIIGKAVLPTLKGTATTGHPNGPGSDPDDDWCDTWYETDIHGGVKEKWGDYFKKWCGDDNVIMAKCPIDGKPEKTCADGFFDLDVYENSVKDPKTKFYFCAAHGDYSAFWFQPYVKDNAYVATKTGSKDYRGSVEELMENRGPMPFAFLLHCDAMDSKEKGTIEYYFRKGENTNTVIIGLKHTTWTSYCAYYDWYPPFLSDIDENGNKKIKDAYDDACDTYPDIIGHIDFSGDTELTLNQILGMSGHDTALSISFTDINGSSISEAYVGDTIYITGILIDYETRDLLQNAEITLYRNNTKTNLTGITNENGEYSIPYTVVEADYPSVVFKTKFGGSGA